MLILPSEWYRRRFEYLAETEVGRRKRPVLKSLIYWLVHNYMNAETEINSTKDESMPFGHLRIQNTNWGRGLWGMNCLIAQYD